MEPRARDAVRRVSRPDGSTAPVGLVSFGGQEDLRRIRKELPLRAGSVRCLAPLQRTGPGHHGTTPRGAVAEVASRSWLGPSVERGHRTGKPQLHLGGVLGRSDVARRDSGGHPREQVGEGGFRAPVASPPNPAVRKGLFLFGRTGCRVPLHSDGTWRAWIARGQKDEHGRSERRRGSVGDALCAIQSPVYRIVQCLRFARYR